MMAAMSLEQRAESARGRSSKAHILCVTSGLAGILYSSVELARRLAAAGHRITYASFDHARELVEGNGLDFHELDHSRYERFIESDRNNGPLHRLAHLEERRRKAAASTGVEDFASWLGAAHPDLVLIDGEMHEHIIAASSTAVPLAVMNSFCSIWKHPGLPPPHCFARPGAGWRGTRIGSSMLWLALGLRKRHRAWMQKVRRIGCDRLSVLCQLADWAGFDLRREADDSQWLIPFTYRTLPALSLHALEFEFPHRPFPHVRYVGPMVLENRKDTAMVPAERQRLEGVLERHRQESGASTLIYAGFGSVLSTERELLDQLVRTVANRPDWRLVISLSRRLRPSDLGPLPERVHAFSWTPQTQVLQHADVMVTHGGINTLDECVTYGVPMLVYRGGETDMAGNAARVVYHGLGIAGDGRRDGVDDIRHHLDRLLHNSEFADNVEHMRRRYRAYIQDRVAERTVDLLLGGSTEDPTPDPGEGRS
jgi:UDP:flavonoid glycosyltransferase YjiC (YdhE family)